MSVEDIDTLEKLFEYSKTHGSKRTVHRAFKHGMGDKFMDMVAGNIKNGARKKYVHTKNDLFKFLKTSAIENECEVKGTDGCEDAIIVQARQKMKDGVGDLSAEMNAIRHSGNSNGRVTAFNSMVMWTYKGSIPIPGLEDLPKEYSNGIITTNCAYSVRARRSTDLSFQVPDAKRYKSDGAFCNREFPCIPHTGWRVMDVKEHVGIEQDGVRVNGDDTMVQGHSTVLVSLPDPVSLTMPCMWIKSKDISATTWKAIPQNDVFLFKSILCMIEGTRTLMVHGFDVIGTINISCLSIRERDGAVVFSKTSNKSAVNFHKRFQDVYTQLAAVMIQMCIDTYCHAPNNIKWTNTASWKNKDGVFSTSCVIGHRVPAALCIAIALLTHPSAPELVCLQTLTRELGKTGRHADWWTVQMESNWPESMRGEAVYETVNFGGHYKPVSLPETQLRQHSIWGPALAAGSLTLKNGNVWPSSDVVIMRELGETYGNAQPLSIRRIQIPQPIVPLVHTRAWGAMISSETGCSFFNNAPILSQCMSAFENVHSVTGAFDTLCDLAPAAMGAPGSLEDLGVGAWAFFNAAIKCVAAPM